MSFPLPLFIGAFVILESAWINGREPEKQLVCIGDGKIKTELTCYRRLKGEFQRVLIVNGVSGTCWDFKKVFMTKLFKVVSWKLCMKWFFVNLKRITIETSLKFELLWKRKLKNSPKTLFLDNFENEGTKLKTKSTWNLCKMQNCEEFNWIIQNSLVLTFAHLNFALRVELKNVIKRSFRCRAQK